MNSQLSILAGRTLAVAIATALSFGASTQANAEIIPKQLSGPPSDFATMRSPDPVEATIHSRSALIPVEMLVSKNGSHWSHSLPVENGNLRFALLTPGVNNWSVSLTSPNGEKINADATAKRGKGSSFGIGGAQVPAELFSFENISNGNWKIDLHGNEKSASAGYLLLEGDGNTELASYATHSRQVVGQSLGITASLSGVDFTGKALVGHDAGHIQRATLKVTSPDGSVSILPMFDDGLNSDGLAGDGLFGADFNTKMAGNYVAQVTIEGKDRAGNRVIRTAEHLLPFVEPSISITGDRAIARTEKSAASRLMINIPVTAPKDASHYRSYAEVWGKNAAGKSIPVAWVGGMVTPQNGNFSLGFDERWVIKSGAQAPFELRNVRIDDPDTSVSITTADRMDLSLPTLRNRAKAADIVIDEMMTMGPRPATISQAKGVGKRLVLVHGYCSGGVWPAAQFTNASSFLDANKSRSHDAFARLLQTYGNTWNSFGVVAHSQGGAASLHLYNYYWSGLDNATGNRLIQSVGTPYKGTNLAGILATLGNWFGVGCGTNSDLTYNGASSWLAGISNASRAKVNYYTTSFKLTNWYTNDYCQVATDLVLNDPEDGTTEQVNGQLPGGVNRGHATGQCHTASMRDPAQYLNASRNSTMNTNAAR